MYVTDLAAKQGGIVRITAEHNQLLYGAYGRERSEFTLPDPAV